jgi:hypothetical protein
MGIYVPSTGFRLLISKIYYLFLQVDETDDYTRGGAVALWELSEHFGVGNGKLRNKLIVRNLAKLAP